MGGDKLKKIREIARIILECILLKIENVDPLSLRYRK